MRRWLLILLAVPLLADYPLRDLVECVTRQGTPNVQAKLKAGKTVRIAYLGGSITAAPGWRVKTRTWFAKQYPEATVEEIFAAIGGTGSDLGVFRLQQDVLDKKPDLLFVEFAVNDGGAQPERIHKAMEGIVRQTWRADPNTDICYVYTVSDHLLKAPRQGKMQRSASAMEELADHYGIPSIHFGAKVVAMEKAGELVVKAPKPEDLAAARPIVFSSDGVHPHVATGHVIYADTVARSWPAIADANSAAGPHVLPEPFRADNWQRARQVSIRESMLSGDWVRLPSDKGLGHRFRRNMPVLYESKSPGASLSFRFRGTTASVFDLLGPTGGQLEITVDGKTREARRIDGYCTYHRMSRLSLATELPEAVHDVRITLTDTALDKRSFLFEKNRADFDKKPEKYAERSWHAASLLIIGEIVED